MRKGMAIAASIAALLPLGVAGTASAAPTDPTTTFTLCNDTSTDQAFVIIGSLTGQIDDRLEGNTCHTETVSAPFKAPGNGLAQEDLTIARQNFNQRCGAGYLYERCDYETEAGTFVVIQGGGKSGFGNGPAQLNLSAGNPTGVVDFQIFA